MSFFVISIQEKCAYYANGFDNMSDLLYSPTKTGLRFPAGNGIFPEI